MSDVAEARRKDDTEFNDLLQQVRAIELPDDLPADWKGFLDTTRVHIDELKVRARQIGGDTTQILDFLNTTRGNLANVWRICNRGNAEALSLYERAEAMSRAQDELFEGDFVNQMMRKDDCIPRDEIVPALLCESAAAVAAFWGVLPEPERVSARQWAAKIVVDAQKEGFDIMSIRDQLYAIGWPRS